MTLYSRPCRVLMVLLFATFHCICVGMVMVRAQRPAGAQNACPAGPAPAPATVHEQEVAASNDATPPADKAHGADTSLPTASTNPHTRHNRRLGGRGLPTPAPTDLRAGYLKRIKYTILGSHVDEHVLVYTDVTASDTTASSSSSSGSSPSSNTTTIHDKGDESRDGRGLCKFYNLSPRQLHLVRQDDATGRFELMHVLDPVSTVGVTCTAGDHYIWLDRQRPEKPTHQVWIPRHSAERHFVYQEPIDNLPSQHQQEEYMRYLRGIMFDEVYRNTSGRSYLASSYPPRPPPQHPFWSADYVGQEHLVELDGVPRSLLVLSSSPRVLVMDHFVQSHEVTHLQALAHAQGFAASATVSPNDSTLDRRTSQTTWLLRKSGDPVVQAIYQRAAQLLQIPNLMECCAEDLQVVQYDAGQEYRAHYDFVLPTRGAHQPVRFATLLIYLQGTPTTDDMGGETVFPLAVGGPLSVKPQAGTAVLFYSLLPDGNVDERSLHAATPVAPGYQKQICNLWIWDPVVDLDAMD